MKKSLICPILLMSNVLLNASYYEAPAKPGTTKENPKFWQNVPTWSENYDEEKIREERRRVEQAKQETERELQRAARKQGEAMGQVGGLAEKLTAWVPTEKTNKEAIEAGQANVAKTFQKATGAAANFAGLAEQIAAYGQKQMEDWNRTDFTTEEKINKLKNYAYWGIVYATIPLVGYTIAKGGELAMDVIRAELLSPKPAILNKKQKPVYGRTDRMRRWYAGTKAQEMVFNPEVKDRLTEIEKKTTSLRDLIKSGKDRNYANLLLYGEPGTGKTLFAQVLAEKTNMDFLPVTAASLLQAGVEGIKYFDEIITMANRSKYGTIIFVDEADALFIDRSTIDPGSEHYKVLNHILSIVDGRSNKFMVVAATNHAYLLDPAMGRRFQDRVLMPLPDAATRTDLLNLYVPQILFNIKQTSKQFVTAAKELFSPALITHIAERTAGLSHAEIADMIEAMRNKAELNKRSLIIQDIQSAIDEAIEKRKKSEEDKKLREQRKEQGKQTPAIGN